MLALDVRKLTQSRAGAKETPVSSHLYMALGIATHLAHAAQYSDDAIASAYHALCQALHLNPAVHNVQPITGISSKRQSRLLTTPSARHKGGYREDRPEDGSLSARQRSILGLIAGGLSNKEIARSLGISPETVKTHVANIFVKLGVERRAQAVAFAHTLGMIQNTTTLVEA